MIRAPKLVVSRPMYAFNPATWRQRPHFGWPTVDAVWFRRKNGKTLAAMGTYDPHVLRRNAEPADDTYEAWIAAADDNRYGGHHLASWDGQAGRLPGSAARVRRLVDLPTERSVMGGVDIRLNLTRRQAEAALRATLSVGAGVRRSADPVEAERRLHAAISAALANDDDERSSTGNDSVRRPGDHDHPRGLDADLHRSRLLPPRSTG